VDDESVSRAKINGNVLREKSEKSHQY
jgi:hypothetical protein